jgi:hypothetical protein
MFGINARGFGTKAQGKDGHKQSAAAGLHVALSTGVTRESKRIKGVDDSYCENDEHASGCAEAVEYIHVWRILTQKAT